MRRQQFYTLLAALAVINVMLVYLSSIQQGVIYMHEQFVRSHSFSKNIKIRSTPLRNDSRPLKNPTASPTAHRQQRNTQSIIDYLLDNVGGEENRHDLKEEKKYTSIFFHAIERCATTTIKTLLLKHAIYANLTVYKTGRSPYFSSFSSNTIV